MWCGEELVTKHRRIQRGFLMSVDRDAATEPRKTGLSTIRERNFGAAHGFTHEVPHAGSKRWQRADTRRQRRPVHRQNSVSVGCGLRRAGATGGGRDGRPRESRVLRATTGSSMAARIRIREPQRGHSNAQWMHISSPYQAAEKPIRNDECAVGAVYGDVNELRWCVIPLRMQGGEYARFQFVHTFYDRPHLVDSLKNGRSQSAPTVARFVFFSSLLTVRYHSYLANATVGSLHQGSR